MEDLKISSKFDVAHHIKNSLDSYNRKELNDAMLYACLAVDSTSKKLYTTEDAVGKRFKQFIIDNIDIIELMLGLLNVRETIFPFKNKKGKIGLKLEDIIYEIFRCNLCHGNELPDGYAINFRVKGKIHILIDTNKQSIIFPETIIFALGLPCVLSPVNKDQKIGDISYYYRDPINYYVIDRWWGKLNCAREIMDFDGQPKIKLDFSECLNI